MGLRHPHCHHVGSEVLCGRKGCCKHQTVGCPTASQPGILTSLPRGVGGHQSTPVPTPPLLPRAGAQITKMIPSAWRQGPWLTPGCHADTPHYGSEVTKPPEKPTRSPGRTHAGVHTALSQGPALRLLPTRVTRRPPSPLRKMKADRERGTYSSFYPNQHLLASQGGERAVPPLSQV